MAVLEDTQALVNDALFRAGEIPGASEWDAKAVDYINREYRALCSGASEFLPEYIHDWWWMRATGVFTLLPIYNTDTISVVQDSLNATLSIAPTISLQGYRLKINTESDMYVISNHTAGTFDITLDSQYTGLSNAAVSFTAMKTTYTLAANVDSLMSPLNIRNTPVMGLTPERMDILFPQNSTSIGVPQAFCLEDERTIRFDRAGRNDGLGMRVEYRYRPAVVDLVNSPINFPLVPLQFRHVLADMTLVYLMFDKNDDRATAVGASARSTLGAMAKENTRRLTKMDGNVGRIMPRSSSGRSFRDALRTESGLIIG